jgi:hypothetical protein
VTLGLVGASSRARSLNCRGGRAPSRRSGQVRTRCSRVGARHADRFDAVVPTASIALTAARPATSVATSRSSDASVASANPDDANDLARSRRIWHPSYQVEGLVQANWVEVRVLFGACKGPAQQGLLRSSGDRPWTSWRSWQRPWQHVGTNRWIAVDRWDHNPGKSVPLGRDLALQRGLSLSSVVST